MYIRFCHLRQVVLEYLFALQHETLVSTRTLSSIRVDNILEYSLSGKKISKSSVLISPFRSLWTVDTMGGSQISPLRSSPPPPPTKNSMEIVVSLDSAKSTDEVRGIADCNELLKQRAIP